MCSFLNNLFTVTGKNNTMYSKIGLVNLDSKLPIVIFQMNSISLIESEEFRETSIKFPELNESDLNQLKDHPVCYLWLGGWVVNLIQLNHRN